MLEKFFKTVEKDVRFLESLRIMDYSLFLIILEMPELMVDRESEDSIKMTCNDGSLLKRHH
jgi:hypothetical protein